MNGVGGRGGTQMDRHRDKVTGGSLHGQPDRAKKGPKAIGSYFYSFPRLFPKSRYDSR